MPRPHAPAFRRCHCFVSLPDNAIARKIYFSVVKPVVTEDNQLAVSSFLDRSFPEGFASDVKTYIAFSNFVVAIITNNNPNVLYEIGLAVGFGKPLILFKDRDSPLPTIYDESRLHIKTLRQRANEHVQSVLRGNFADERFQIHTAILAGARSEGGARSRERRRVSIRDMAAINQAYAAYNDKEYGKVIRLLAPRQKSKHFDGDCCYWLADSYFLLAEGVSQDVITKKRHYQCMWETSSDGAERFPDHLHVVKSLGLACLKLGKLDDAVALFRKLIERDRSFHVARYNLACAHSLMGDLPSCLTVLSELFAFNPEWRFLARLDPDFGNMWKKDLFQRLLFPSGTKTS